MAKRMHKDGTSTYERQHGQGSIYEDRHNGTWVASLTIPVPGGKRKRRTVRARTKSEASARLRELL
jgi:beta-lactamase class A